MTDGRRRRYAAPTRFTNRRLTSAEHLDDTTLSANDRAASYRDLERFDRWPFQYGPLEAGVLRLLRGAAVRPVEILEVGAGTGHTGRRLAMSLRRRGIDVRLHLTDRCLEFLESTAGNDEQVSRIDWLTDPLPAADIVVANLVLHHFETPVAVTALSRAARAARIGGVIYDLNRHAVVFHFLRLTLPLVATSPMTLADGLISVQQSFTPAELAELARAAGIVAPEVTTHGLLRNRLLWRSAA
ncbi:MAG: methyltransferase [Candidatus Eisenbacteria bacterium]|nr:methyltransferase [Candidatus Eisenbacteria bacterium]